VANERGSLLEGLRGIEALPSVHRCAGPSVCAAGEPPCFLRSSVPALEWAVRRTRGQRAAGSARKSVTLALVRPSVPVSCAPSQPLPNRSWSNQSTTVLLRWRVPAPCRPCGVPQRLGCWSVLAPAIARAARRSAVGLAKHNRVACVTARPNPSIEGTCNIRLRLLSHAPHVKR